MFLGALFGLGQLSRASAHVRPGAGRGSSLALCLLAVNSVLALQLKGSRLLTPGDWVVCEVLKGLGSCTAVGEGVLKAIVVHMRVCAGVFLDGVHPLVVQFGSSRHWWHHGSWLQGLQTTWSLGCRKRLDDANRRRIHATQHLNVTVVKQRQGFILFVQFLIHTVDKNAERNPEYQGENQDGPYNVVCQKLSCEQFQTVNDSATYLTSLLRNTLEYHGQAVLGVKELESIMPASCVHSAKETQHTMLRRQYFYYLKITIFILEF